MYEIDLWLRYLSSWLFFGQPYGNYDDITCTARFGFLNPEMHNLSTLYLFWVIFVVFGGVLLYFVCTKLSNKYFGCAKNGFHKVCILCCQTRWLSKRITNFPEYYRSYGDVKWWIKNCELCLVVELQLSKSVMNWYILFIQLVRSPKYKKSSANMTTLY